MHMAVESSDASGIGVDLSSTVLMALYMRMALLCPVRILPELNQPLERAPAAMTATAIPREKKAEEEHGHEEAQRRNSAEPRGERSG